MRRVKAGHGITGDKEESVETKRWPMGRTEQKRERGDELCSELWVVLQIWKRDWAILRPGYTLIPVPGKEIQMS